MCNSTKCKKCNGTMRVSKGFINTWTSSDDFGGDAGQRGTTQSQNGLAIEVDCLKCDECGHSYIPKGGIYPYRNLPCSAGDSCYYIVGKDDYTHGGGILEWCRSEEDMKTRYEYMKQYPQFSSLKMECSMVTELDNPMSEMEKLLKRFPPKGEYKRVLLHQNNVRLTESQTTLFITMLQHLGISYNVINDTTEWN